MRVLHIGCSYLPYKGGGAVRLRRLVESCNSGEVSLFLATHTPYNTAEDDEPFLRVLRDEGINGLGRNEKLIEFIREVKPDVVVLHNSRVLMTWMLFYRRIFPNVKTICEIHSVRESTWLHSVLNSWLYQRCDCVVVLSHAMKNHLETSMGKKCPRVEVVYSGVENIGAPALKGQRIYDPSSVHYAYIGSFHDWQGVLVLAEAVKLIDVEFWQKNRLTFVGSGPAAATVQRIVGPDIMGLDSFRFLGWQPLEAIGSIISEVDFLLAPRISSLATELTVPLKVFESIQYRRPLVASNVGGLAELLDAEESACLFVKPGCAQSLADQIRNPVDKNVYLQMQKTLDDMSKRIPRWSEASSQYMRIAASLKAEG